MSMVKKFSLHRCRDGRVEVNIEARRDPNISSALLQDLYERAEKKLGEFGQASVGQTWTHTLEIRFHVRTKEEAARAISVVKELIELIREREERIKRELEELERFLEEEIHDELGVEEEAKGDDEDE